jgi:hypothetical protein
VLIRPVLGAAVVMGVLALTATGAVFMAVHPTDTSGRLWHQLGGYSVALVMTILSGWLLWRYLLGGPVNRPTRTLLAAALILVVVVDLWQFSAKFVRLESSEADAVWTDARAIIGSTTSRVLPWGLSVFSQNGAIQSGLASVFGYVPLEPAALTTLVASVPDPRSTAYDVLGVEYVVSETPLDAFASGDRPLALAGQQGKAWVYRRSRVLPVARLVTRYEVIADREAAVARLHAADFDPAQTVILDEPPACAENLAAGDVGSAQIAKSAPGYWLVRTRSDGAALLIVAENDYPGWIAKVDGEPAEFHTAYTTSRAVCVPAGSHEVIMEFAPRNYIAGAAATLVSLLVVAAAAVRLNRSTAERPPVLPPRRRWL